MVVAGSTKPSTPDREAMNSSSSRVEARLAFAVDGLGALREPFVSPLNQARIRSANHTATT